MIKGLTRDSRSQLGIVEDPPHGFLVLTVMVSCVYCGGGGGIGTRTNTQISAILSDTNANVLVVTYVHFLFDRHSCFLMTPLCCQ